MEKNMNFETKTDLISVLYYKAFNASLLGKFQEMKMFFGLLEQEYKKSSNKSSFQKFFTKERFEELKLIKQQVEKGQFFEVFETFEPLEHEYELSPTEILEEKIIVKKVAKNQELLEEFLGKKLYLQSLEHLCGEGDKCDMVSINDDNTLFPIEFKLKKATHAVVGQIGKYCLHFKLKLINNLYDRVQGVIVANSYSKYAINELKKRGYICLIHSGDIEHLRINSI